MQRKYRRLIFYIFAALFVISVPFILLYTNGYRYNFKKNKFEKTGALLVNSVIKNPVLYIGDIAYSGKNEFRLQDLLPGEYNVKLAKTGYFDWEKKLVVESQLTTFAKDVRLIANNLPISVAKASGSLFPSPDASKFIYIATAGKKYSLVFFNISDGAEKNIFESDAPIDGVSWSYDNNKIIVQSGGTFQIINSGDAKIYALPLKNITSLRWDEKSGFSLIAKTAGGIYKIDTLFNTASKIYAPKSAVSDFNSLGNYLYTTDSRNLTQIDLGNKEEVAIPFERAGYKIKQIDNKKIFLGDGNGHLQIFSLPLVKNSTPELFANAKDFQIIGNSVLYYNDFEIWTFDFGSGEKELITRIGSEIKKAQWLPDESYIIFLSAGQIKAIETDKRDSRQIYSFPKFETIDDLLASKYTLYFTGKTGGDYSIYKLEL